MNGKKTHTLGNVGPRRVCVFSCLTAHFMVEWVENPIETKETHYDSHLHSQGCLLPSDHL